MALLLFVNRVFKYRDVLEKYNQNSGGRIWWNMTLGAFLVKEFAIPEIIYSCLDVKNKWLENK